MTSTDTGPNDPPKIIALIPARGGSKGIPRKNLVPVAGKPLLAYSIEAARGSKYVTRVVVSTDDAEIGAAAKRHGAEVIWRPSEISGDTDSSESALLHSLEYLQQAEEYEPEFVVFLQCTSPLTVSEDVDGTIEVLLAEDADSALAVTPFHYFLWQKDHNGETVGINHDKRTRPRRQEREPQFLETGAVYVMRAEGFKKAKHRFFGKTAMYAMPPERRLEIDQPVDLCVAEGLMLLQQRHQRLQALPDPVAALVLDFDGVFTDNRVMVFQDGREAVVCNRSDGWGLAEFSHQLAIPIVVLSTEENPVVQARCDKLGIECIQGIKDKLTVLVEWLRQNSTDLAQVVYVGNDVNDLGCLEAVGCGVVVSDAHPMARTAARIILSAPGGAGAIREVTELIRERLEVRTQ